MSQIQRATAGSRRIPAGSLKSDAFAPFGEVIQNPATHHGRPDLEKAAANQGTATVWNDVTHLNDYYHLARSQKAAKAVMRMFVCKPRELELKDGRELFSVKILERHPFTPQTFIPLGLNPEDTSTRYLVIVAPTLPLQSARKTGDLQPPYPIPEPRRKLSLRERLLGARPNPFTNDFAPTTTPNIPPSAKAPKPKGPGLPDLDNIKAFIARGDQAVTYGPGTWHAPMVALGAKEIEFIVVQYVNGVGIEDCQEVEISASDGGDGLSVDLNVHQERAKL